MGVDTRLVTVWIPDWPIIAAGVAAGDPAIVLRSQRVIASTPAARADGIRFGDRRRVAQRVCPQVRLIDDDPRRDARRFESVVQAVAELTPRVEVAEPGELRFAARGPSRYFGGETTFAERLARVVSEAAAPVGDDVPVGVGIADGRATAAIAARRAVGRAPIIVPPGQSPTFMAELPIGWLAAIGEVDADLVDLFIRLGITTGGDLAALNPADLHARFGSIGYHAHRLASGADDRPVVAAAPAPERSYSHPFPEPVGQLATVVFTAKRLADTLVADLAGHGMVCTRVIVIAETDHGERSERTWYRDGGLSSAAIVDRVRWQLDAWVSQPDGPTAGVVLVRLIGDEVQPNNGVQTSWWGGRSRADEDAERAITRLAAIAGEDRVVMPEWVGGRLPEERFRWVAATTVDPDHRHLEPDSPWPGTVPSPSPASVTSIPVELLDADGRSVMVAGRGDLVAKPVTLVIGSRHHTVVAWAGPWPIEQRWWSPERARRLARLQVVTDDDAAYLVGVERQRWSILATYA